MPCICHGEQNEKQQAFEKVALPTVFSSCKVEIRDLEESSQKEVFLQQNSHENFTSCTAWESYNELCCRQASGSQVVRCHLTDHEEREVSASRMSCVEVFQKKLNFVLNSKADVMCRMKEIKVMLC